MMFSIRFNVENCSKMNLLRQRLFGISDTDDSPIIWSQISQSFAESRPFRFDFSLHICIHIYGCKRSSSHGRVKVEKQQEDNAYISELIKTHLHRATYNWAFLRDIY